MALRWGNLGSVAILTILKGLGGDICKNDRSVKMSITMVCWPQIGVLGDLFGGLLLGGPLGLSGVGFSMVSIPFRENFGSFLLGFL